MTVVKVSRIAVRLSSDQDALIRHAAEVEGTSVFDSGEPSLAEYLRKRVLGNHVQGASRCFVACRDGRVVGYYALASASVQRRDVTGKVGRNMPDPVPVILLSRLAVNRKEQGSGLGKNLLRDAILRSVQAPGRPWRPGADSRSTHLVFHPRTNILIWRELPASRAFAEGRVQGDGERRTLDGAVGGLEMTAPNLSSEGRCCMRENVHMPKDLDARLAEADGSDVSATLVHLGCDLSDAGRHLDAESCFRRAVALGDDWVWFNVGNELQAQGRPDQAVHAYQKAIAAGENDAWLNLGFSLEDLGDLAGAMDACRHADQVGDKNGALSLAYLLREQGEYDEAERQAQRAASLGNLQGAGTAACWAYGRTLDPALEDDLRRGANHYPAARTALADLLRTTGRFEEARQELSRGAKLGEQDSWLPLGNLLSDHLGDLEAAEDAFRAGIAAGDRNCHNNLGILLLEQDDEIGAEEQFREGARLGDQLAARALKDLLDDQE